MRKIIDFLRKYRQSVLDYLYPKCWVWTCTLRTFDGSAHSFVDYINIADYKAAKAYVRAKEREYAMTGLYPRSSVQRLRYWKTYRAPKV